MNESLHQPTPEFERFLEWQVTSALRRHDRFAEPAKTGYRKYVAILPIVIVSMLIGAGGVTAAGRIQANQQKQRLIEQQQADIQIAQMQLEIAEKTAEETRRRTAAAGLVGSTDGVEALRDMLLARWKLQKLQLNIAEIDQSGQPVQDDLTSPLVNGRDFVTERLGLDASAALQVTTAAQTRMGDIKRRLDVGVASPLEMREAEAAMIRARAETQTIQKMVELRHQFLAGGMKPEDVARQRLLITTRIQAQVAESDLALAESRFESFQAKYRVGLVQEVDLLKAQVELLTKRQDMAAVLKRLKELEQGR